MNNKPLTFEECKVGMRVKLHRSSSLWTEGRKDLIFLLTGLVTESNPYYTRITSLIPADNFLHEYGIYPRHIQKAQNKPIIILDEEEEDVTD